MVLAGIVQYKNEMLFRMALNQVLQELLECLGITGIRFHAEYLSYFWIHHAKLVNSRL
jgi:hypothetical protein